MDAELSAAVHRPYLKAETSLSAQVDITPQSGTSIGETHFAICIDTSRSMSGDKLARAKAALTDWVFALIEDSEYVSIVAFDSAPTVVLEHTRWGDVDRAAVEDTVNSLSAGGKTDLFGALETASELLETTANTKSVARRILVLSDGKQNEPPKSEGAFADLATRIDDTGTRIRAGGLGTDYDEAAIRTLGTSARGRWLHLEAPQEIREFFGSAIEEAQTVIGTDVALELDLHPDVTITDAYRAAPQVQPVDVNTDDGLATIRLPDLTERTQQHVALELRAPDCDPGTVTLADVQLCCGEQTVKSTPITVTYTNDNEKLRQVNESVDLHLQKTRIRSELGSGDVEAAETILEETKLVHSESAVGDLEQAVTKVEEDGSRATRNRSTIVEAGSDKIDSH